MTINYELGKLSAKGTYPIYLLVFENHKKRRVRLDLTANQSDIKDKKIVNRLILKKIEEAIVKEQHRMIILETTGHTGTELSVGKDKEVHVDFIAFGRKHVEQLRNEGRDKTAQSYNYALNNLCKFIGGDSLDVSNVTKSFLQQYQEWFSENNFGRRAWELCMSCLRALHNKAKEKFNDDDEGVIVVKGSPFQKVEFIRSKAERSKIEKRALSAESIRIIAELPMLKDELAEMAKNAFLLSFYFCGMNACDLYAYDESLESNEIHFYRQKTERRSGEDSFLRITIPPEAKRPIDGLFGVIRTFCFRDRYSTADCLNAALNKGLKRLAAHCNSMYDEDVLPHNLTFYAARHSWATIASNDCGIPPYVIDKALCHVQSSIAMQSYIRKDFKDVDDANRNVIDFVFGKNQQ